MAKNLTDEQINKIAETLAAKLAEPGGPAPLGCGSASGSEYYYCSGSSYNCSGSYECGVGGFSCRTFTCRNDFGCDQGFGCITTFDCQARYTGPY
ncbi:MAG: hypothetical protein JW759_10600 [Candidatus Coatesbacteria bacterium]|nr:hypothetical protein [Candidatus Coatesbacteria bacterium]